MFEIEDVTCIRFVPRTTQNDFVRINGDSSGCSSHVGRIGRAQRINLNSKNAVGSGCFRKFTIVHELLHTLGWNLNSPKFLTL